RSGIFHKPEIMLRVVGKERAAPAPMTISAKGTPMITQTIRRRILQGPRPFAMPDVYQKITNQIVAALEQGVRPWRAIATMATGSWSERSLPRDTIKLLSRCYGESVASVRLHEQADNASRALGARRRARGHDLRRHLVLGQARCQVSRLEVG